MQKSFMTFMQLSAFQEKVELTLTSMQYIVQQVEYNVSLSVNKMLQKHVNLSGQILRQAEQAS